MAANPSKVSARALLVGDLIWDRLKPAKVTIIQDFATLSNEEIQNIAKERPQLSDERMIELKDKVIEFLNNNGGILNY